MSTTQHKLCILKVPRWYREKTLFACFSVAVLVTLLISCGNEVSAQRRFTKEYPARPNVRLHLRNHSGTITVIAWNNNKIKVVASMESPAARCAPELSDGGLVIDMMRENRGRDDVGDVNFTIQVPVDSTVDVETRRGNITVRGVHGAMVRAHVSSEGDIELTGIRASTVMAENTMGNILFDAELLRNGVYELRSMQGVINLRISANASFQLIAAAPRTRNIDLGGFRDKGYFEFFSGNRKVVGKVGEGGATLNTLNQRGSIVLSFR